MVSTFCAYLYATLIIFVSINASVIIVICAASEEKKWKKRRQSQSHAAVGMQRRFDGETQLLMASIAAVWIQPRSMLVFATAEVLMLTQTLKIIVRACGSPNTNKDHNGTIVWIATT